MKVIVAAAGGIVMGILVSIVVSRAGLPAEPLRKELTTTVAPTNKEPLSSLTQQHKLAELEERLNHIESLRKGIDGDGAATTQPTLRGAQPSIEEPSRDVAFQKGWERHLALVRSVEEQKPDPAWSAEAQRSFDKDLRRLGANVARVDCRMTACIATIQWPTRQQASATYDRLLDGDYTLACDRSIFLDKSDGREPYEAKLVLECEQVRVNPNR
jgi:hypothetical protein